MALARMWQELPWQLIPNSIKENAVYQEEDWWVDRARITNDKMYVGIWFDKEAKDQSHLWKYLDGAYRLVRRCKWDGTSSEYRSVQ